MEIHLALTEDIINQSLKLHYKHASFRQRYSILYVPVILFGVAVYLIIKSLQQPQFDRNGWLGILYVGMAAAYYFWMQHRREHTGKKLLQSMAENAVFEMKADDDELVTYLSDATYQHQWPAFIKALISKELVLLYQQNQSFSMFHYSFFDNNDFDLFKQMVKKHVHVVTEV